MLARKLNALWYLSGMFARCALLYGARAAWSITWALRRCRKQAGVHTVEVPGLAAPIALRGKTSDAYVFEQIFVHDELAFHDLGTPSTVIDGGANIGLATLYLLRRFPQARIVAVEFEAENFAMLERNCRAYPNVSCVHAALWPHEGFVGVSNAQDDAWAYQAREASADACGAVRTITIEQLRREHDLARIDMLKLDIEGAEFELFEHEPAWLDHVGVLAVELHDRVRPGCSRRLFDALRSRTFALRGHGEYLLIDIGARLAP